MKGVFVDRKVCKKLKLKNASFMPKKTKDILNIRVINRLNTISNGFQVTIRYGFEESELQLRKFKQKRNTFAR